MNISAKIQGIEPIPELPFKSLWPWPSLVTPYYEIMFVYVSIGGIVTQIGIPATDALVMDLYYHVSSMFDMISNDLANLINTTNGKIYF